MPTGTITWVNATLEHAFIAPDTGGEDVFFDWADVAAAGHVQPVPAAGSRVAYDLRSGRKGRRIAVNVVPRAAAPAEQAAG